MGAWRLAFTPRIRRGAEARPHRKMNDTRYGYEFLESVCDKLDLDSDDYDFYWRYSMSPRGYPAIYIEQDGIIIAPLLCFGAGSSGFGIGLTGREHKWQGKGTQARVDQMAAWVNDEISRFGPRAAGLAELTSVLFST